MEFKVSEKNLTLLGKFWDTRENTFMKSVLNQGDNLLVGGEGGLRTNSTVLEIEQNKFILVDIVFIM